MMAQHLPISLLVPCASIEEAQIALRALEAFRTGGGVAGPPDASSPIAGLAVRIEKALRGGPLSDTREIVLRMLLESAPGTWVEYPAIQAEFEKRGLAKERAAAALRDLSWAMKEYLPPQDVAAFPRKIEVLADRSRAGGVYRYRLTDAGRAAVRRFLETAVRWQPKGKA
jgi:hypothetical protein